MATIVGLINKHRIWFLIIITIIGMSVINPKFLSYDNIYGLFISQNAYGMAAFGLAVSLIGGEMNISIASILALSGVVFVSFLETLGVLHAFLLAIAIS